MPDPPALPRGIPPRQENCLRQLVDRAGSDPGIAAVILVGSLAAGTADPLSDVDLLLVTADGGFGRAWDRRHELHAADAVVCWDQAGPGAPEIAVHRWVGADGVLVEALLFGPASGVRVAEPALVVAGDPGALGRLPRRPPIDRAEMTGASHPIEAAYDTFKARCRDVAADSRR
jgi:Nucleotidyltransferase domain